MQCRLRRRELHVLGTEASRPREARRQLGEIELRPVPLEVERGHVVGRRRHLGGLVAAEPNAGLLPRLADFRHPFPPFPLPDAPVRRYRRVRIGSIFHFEAKRSDEAVGLIKKIGKQVGVGMKK